MALHRVMMGCCVLTIGLVSASRAYSDPVTVQPTIVITSGSVILGTGLSGFSAIDLNGVGFSLIGTSAQPIYVGPRIDCFPCEEGASIPTGGTAVSAVAGTMTYMGQTRELDTGIDGDSVTFEFSGPTFTAPPVPEVSGSILTLTAPFTFVGSVNLSDESGQPMFRANLLGRGLAELQLEAFRIPEVSYWWYKGASYRFTDASAPIPEPGSLLLLAGGLAGVLRKRFGRTRI